MNKIEEASEVLLNSCLELKPKEKLLVLCNRTEDSIANALYEKAASRSQAMLVKSENKIEELLKSTSFLLKKQDALIVLTKEDFFNLNEIKKAVSKGAKAVILPGINKKIFEKTINVEYEKIRKEAIKLEDKMKKAKKIRVISSNGTDFEFQNNLNETKKDKIGRISKGEYCILPTGEVYTSLEKTTGKGIIVVDSMLGLCKPHTKLLAKKGKIQEIEGDDAFRKLIEKNSKKKRIESFGIGLNPKATIMNHIIEDNKVKGTCHFVLGGCSNFNSRKPEQSWSAVIIAPTIFFDDEKIMSEGELLI